MMFDQPPNNSPMPGCSGLVGLGKASTSRKRSMDEQSGEVKRSRCNWYIKLESETSSLASEDDTESVYSVQGYETELIQDTPDTDTKSEYSSSSDVDFQVEYEVDDLSGEEENPLAEGSSSSNTDDVLTVAAAEAAAIAAVAAAFCDGSMEAWLTGGEDSDNSSAGDGELNRTEYWTCVQCKSQNNNPLYRYCHECFQMRKKLFPPRPRGHRKRQQKAVKQKKPEDSGIGSQEFGSGSQESVVGSSDSGTGSQKYGIGSGQAVLTFNIDVNIASTSKGIENPRGVKRKSSSVVESEYFNGDDSSKRSRTEDVTNVRVSGDGSKHLGTYGLIPIGNKSKEQQTNEEQKEVKNNDTFEFTKPETKCNGDTKKETEFVKPADVPRQKKLLDQDKSLCIMCENASQDGVFVHSGTRGCVCCCYKCAKRTWVTHKKCPYCTRKVRNIIKICR